jgi:glutaredoxin
MTNFSFRALALSVVATSLLSGAVSSESKLSSFLKDKYSNNPNIKNLQVQIVDSRIIPNSSKWKGIKLRLSGKYNGKPFSENQIFFTNGKNFTENLTSLSGKNWKTIFTPKIQEKHYAKNNLLFGNENSKHKILIFSDPLCPYCQRSVPALLDYVKKYPKTFAVYYYHLPLERMHPASVTLAKLMYLAQIRGDKNAVSTAYFSKVNARESSATKIVNAFNKATGLNYSLQDINSQVINSEAQHDKNVAHELEVRGTPTVFIDGSKTGGEFYKKIQKVD